MFNKNHHDFGLLGWMCVKLISRDLSFDSYPTHLISIYTCEVTTKPRMRGDDSSLLLLTLDFGVWTSIAESHNVSNPITPSGPHIPSKKKKKAFKFQNFKTRPFDSIILLKKNQNPNWIIFTTSPHICTVHTIQQTPPIPTVHTACPLSFLPYSKLLTLVPCTKLLN